MGKESLELPAKLAEMAVEPNSVEELTHRVVIDVESIVAKQHTMPLGTVDLDCGDGPSTEEPKSTRLSAADVLSERVVSLIKYLDGKMAKYAEPTLTDHT